MLNYLFTAYFNDGSTLEQTQEDISSTNSEKSAFYDVMQREKDLIAFSLTNGENIYAVNLIDGHFEINGAKFFLQSFEEPVNFRLIYFRRNVISFNTNGETLSHNIAFHFGWQCTQNDHNYQHTIQIV